LDRTVAAAALAGLLAAGCGGGGAANASAFVGRVTDQGQDAVVGAVSDGTDVSFYVCGGASSFATETRWILGKAGAGGALDITGNGWHVTGNLEAGSGQVQTDQGQTLSWTARPAVGPLEGLYQAMDGTCRTGAVVGDFGDGMGTRLQGTWCDGASHFAQVVPIKNPLSLDGEGIAVTVQSQSAQTLVVARLAEPLPVP
jgi:hypothetical protein